METKEIIEKEARKVHVEHITDMLQHARKYSKEDQHFFITDDNTVETSVKPFYATFLTVLVKEFKNKKERYVEKDIEKMLKNIDNLKIRK